MLWIVGFMTLAWALLFPRQRKTAHRLEAISRKFPLPHELGGQVGVGAGLPHRALARERVIADQLPQRRRWCCRCAVGSGRYRTETLMASA